MHFAAHTALVLSLAFASYATAAEVAVLDNGMRFQAQRIERDGSRVILHTPGGGEIEIGAARLASIEHVEDPPPDVTPAPPAAPQSAEKSVKELVTDAALRYGLPPELVHGVAQAESAYRASAVSPKGAIGIMQLMPATARQLDADPMNPIQNIDAGTRLLRELLLRYEGADNGVRRALAAYNAGDGAVSRYGGVPPYRETQGYVEKVIGLYWKNVRESTFKPATGAPQAGPATVSAAVGSGAGTN
jgi:soluble lytic murein transglycosylase-like protein